MSFEVGLLLRTDFHPNAEGSRWKYDALKILGVATLVSNFVVEIAVSDSEYVIDLELLFRRSIVPCFIVDVLRWGFDVSQEGLYGHCFFTFLLLHNVEVLEFFKS